MYWLHDQSPSVRNVMTVHPTGFMRCETEFHGAVRVTDQMEYNDPVSYFRAKRNAYSDDLAIGFKSVDEEHAIFWDCAVGFGNLANTSFNGIWGYDATLIVERESVDDRSRGFKITVMSRNMKASAEVWQGMNPSVEENWRWDDGFRARKNLYLGKFQEHIQAEIMFIETVKRWIMSLYESQVHDRQDELQEQLEYNQGLGVN